MKLYLNDIEKIVIGSSLLGTGGGGRLDVARNVIATIRKSIEVVSLNNVQKGGLIITSYGIGGLKKKGNVEKTIKKNFAVLSEILKEQPKYLIPAEIGPMSVANIFLLSSIIGLPVVDGDLVGYRSAPEIYLELITLNNTNRLPIVASNSDGETIVVWETKTVLSIENILRNFSSNSKTKVYAAGYPMIPKNLLNFYGSKSINFTQTVGSILDEKNSEMILIEKLKKQGFIFVARGKIINQEDILFSGFTGGRLTIKSGNSIYQTIYKNEYLVFLKNNQLMFTCPDSICLLDCESRLGINNGDRNVGKNVLVFARKAISPWRTKKGLRLFSPRNLGLPYDQKLI